MSAVASFLPGSWSALIAAGVLAMAVFVESVPPERIAVRGPRDVRVAIASTRSGLHVTSSQLAPLVDGGGGAVGASELAKEWRLERRGLQLRAVSLDGRNATAWSNEPFAIAPIDASRIVTWSGKRYRGELRFVAVDTAILVVNVLEIDQYLRGVVPLEIGTRASLDAAAVEAQAIAARSYALVRAIDAVMRPYDLTSGVTDQVYGGRDVEHVSSDAAIANTEGVVITYGGRPVRAPYHAACGGRTADPSDVWVGGGDRFLTSVSDLNPSTGHAWCEIAPKYEWERVFDSPALARAAASGRNQARSVRTARIESTTRSGRVGTLALDTDAETVRLRGNEIRFALRGLGGEILNSTYFSVQPVSGQDGRISQLRVRGRGNGHGVGMCQWGAIGRARAGQRAHDILMAYYPGTVLGQLQR